MITEDYVSFEVAKLLKDKGFDEKTLAYYLVLPNGHVEPFDKKDEYPCAEDIWIKRPTLQMAMKWLREVHNIHITVEPNLYNSATDESNFSRWVCTIITEQYTSFVSTEDDFPTYEEACEAAIKYCLENLI